MNDEKLPTITRAEAFREIEKAAAVLVSLDGWGPGIRVSKEAALSWVSIRAEGRGSIRIVAVGEWDSIVWLLPPKDPLGRKLVL
jgi:hypothetical protein